jgi:hypothetical protein
MDLFKCTKEELAKILTNSVLVKLFPSLGISICRGGDRRSRDFQVGLKTQARSGPSSGLQTQAGLGLSNGLRMRR